MPATEATSTESHLSEQARDSRQAFPPDHEIDKSPDASE
jgi:hypothetical protein